MYRTLTVFTLVLQCFVFSDDKVNSSDNRNVSLFSNTIRSVQRTMDRMDDNGTINNFPKTWLANLFYDTLVNFTVSKNVGSSACQSQTKMYIRHLQNDSIWAMQMSDSWSRYPIGILVGTTHQMGIYEECVNVHRPVQGKYCIPSVTLSSATGEDFTIGKSDQPQNNDHAWREILGFVDYDNQVIRNQVKFSICIPESCTANDLEISLQKEFDKHFLPHRVKALIHVESILCSTDKNEYLFDIGFYLISLLIGLILLVCCLSTVYHLIIIIQFNSGKTHEIKLPVILRSFSVICNGRDLIKYNKNNNLNIFNGIKVLTMILVLFGHKFLYFSINPIMHGKELEKVYTEGPYFLLTCMNLVDPFFYMAGYLMYIMLTSQFNKFDTNIYQIPLVIVYKYLKILPPYAMMMLLTAFIIPHLGDGPFWASRIWPEADRCKNYWWANLLVISNFIKVENQCLIAGWYISCLLQFFVIGTVLIYVCVKNRKIGIYLIILFLCASLIIPFVMTYVYQVYGIVRLMRSFLMDPSNSFEFNVLYRAFYLRGTPFYAGLLAGIVVEELKKRKTNYSLTTVYLGTVVISAICFWVQLYGAVFYDIHRPYNVLEQSLYATLSHCTWTVILFWITVCHFTSGYGPIEKFFNNRFVVPLGRLSYAVYLVNITVMMMIESRQRTAVIPKTEFLIDGWIFGAFRTYMMGILLYFIIEAPFGFLIKHIFYQKKYKNENYTSTTKIRTGTDNKTIEQTISTRL